MIGEGYVGAVVMTLAPNKVKATQHFKLFFFVHSGYFSRDVAELVATSPTYLVPDK